MMIYPLNPVFLLFVLPGVMLSFWAVGRTRRAFARLSRVSASYGGTGAEAARRMLVAEGVGEVSIKRASGMLSDHYDPTARELRLSEGVFDGRSIAALGIACHEAGHAIQHARGYAYLGMRSALVPVINLSSRLYVWVILAGILFHRPQLMLAGVVLLALSVVFALVTLPVEWDASRRARLVLVQEGMVMPGERAAVREVLDAAYLTYVASAVTAVLTLLYYLWSLGLLGRSRDD